MRRQVGNKKKQLLSKMTDVNKEATWAIIGGKDISPLFIPTDAFVCKKCAGKVRYEVNHNEGACSKLHVDAHRHMDETCALLRRRRRGQEGSGHQV